MTVSYSEGSVGHRTFDECPFKLVLPVVTGFMSDHFEIVMQLNRKRLAEKDAEILVISSLEFTDILHRTYSFSPEGYALDVNKGMIRKVFAVPLKRNQILFRNLKLEVTILSQKKRYRLEYVYESEHIVRLNSVLVDALTAEDIQAYRSHVLEYALEGNSARSNETIERNGQGKPKENKRENGSSVYREYSSANEEGANECIFHYKNLSAYRNAVFREMYYLKENGGRKYKITDGRFIDQENGSYCYSFELESELHLADDAPISITASGKEAAGFVIVCEGFQIIVVIDMDLGKTVPSAMINVEPWKLLEALGNKIDHLDRSSRIAIKLAEQGPTLAGELAVPGNIAIGQKMAMDHAREHDITVIWGPPGTGKTYTMSRIAIDAFKEGKRVLIVSHSNISVDGVIKEIRKNVYETEPQIRACFKDGKILRYGYVRDDSLINDPEVVAFNYALDKHPDLKRRMEELRKEKQDLSDSAIYSSKRRRIEEELRKVRSEVRESEKYYAEKATILATTISKVLVDNIFENAKYDIVMFDEVSMAYVPQLVVAASYAKERFICVGDFRQLAPIAQSESRGTLCTDIFTYLGINQYGKVHVHPWLVLLNEQRRMHPAISAFPNRYVYQNLLKDHSKVIHGRDAVAAKQPLPGQAMQLIDLAGTYCAAGKNEDNSRFNILSAIISLGIALQSEAAGESEIGIITPYAAQARLIRAMSMDSAGREKTSISCATVHQFQGSERNVIVFDAVESYPAAQAGILLSKNENGSVERLVNVAITRARGKFITVANTKFWENKFPGSTHIYRELLKYMEDRSFVTGTRDKALQQFIDGLSFGRNIKRFRNREEIKDQLIDDISRAQNQIIVSLPAGERKPGSVIPELLNHERQHGVKILCKALDYKALPDEWKKFTWASEDAIFPLLAVDDTVIWYGVPEFKGLFTDKNRGYYTIFPLVFRITGKHTIEMTKSLTSLDTRLIDDRRSALTEKLENGHRATDRTEEDGKGPSGLARYVQEYVRCTKCGKPTKLVRGFKSGKFYLKCPTCGNMDYLSKDDVNAYINLNNITCPEHHCYIHASLGRYGLYIRCDCGHYVRLDQI